MTSFFTPADSPGRSSPAPECDGLVGAPSVRHPTDGAMSAADLIEQRIRHYGLLMQEAMERWSQDGCFADRGEADRHRIEMETAIAQRTPETVRRMEVERNLV